MCGTRLFTSEIGVFDSLTQVSEGKSSEQHTHCSDTTKTQTSLELPKFSNDSNEGGEAYLQHLQQVAGHKELATVSKRY